MSDADHDMSLTQDHDDFKGPTESVPFDGLLFDMDGTIIDSTPAIIKYWELSVYSVLDRDMALTESVWVESSGWITTKFSRMRMEGE